MDYNGRKNSSEGNQKKSAGKSGRPMYRVRNKLEPMAFMITGCERYLNLILHLDHFTVHGVSFEDQNSLERKALLPQWDGEKLPDRNGIDSWTCTAGRFIKLEELK